MKDSTETLLMFAQLLETEPPILQPDILPQAQQLAANLEQLSENDQEQASALIVDWMKQFPQARTTFKKALAQRNRKEFDEPLPPKPDEIQWTIPNFQIVEEPDQVILSLPAPTPQTISLFSYVRQTLTRWIHNHR
ncbi:hypothetical protein [Spirulina subsalsa]|uniref:hypothetical protein n=1 Tax=Spirulina subsalsa TaxID=54311 RepID=UPI0002E3356F|nr:hypothetical protein [Spirulina subsalsa]